MPGRVFFVTGTSSGFGKNLVEEILTQGDKVVATTRDPTKLNFETATKDNFAAVALDVTDIKSVDQAFETAIKAFGRVDVVINNAGFGLSGPFEELDPAQITQQMNINFIGCINVTRTAMRVMREQMPQGGLIQQISSMAGQKGMPTFSIYCASKWALEGFTEGVAQEVKPEWGIKFTCIEPGGFRTNWAGASMEFPKQRLEAYDHLDARERMGKRNGNQPGDPLKASKAIYQLAVMEEPPARIALGSDAYQLVMTKLDDYRKIYTKYEDLSRSTDIQE
ncbi:hypothetical protein PV10_05201 [Exophiala mesophila]|uniref:Short-chain dehydrogenase/reductase SDR n=1 Tax=Exophiala mesophila TaxID=212818 RepID=A0A0D1ZJF7_EXOME|nr:uncharacterized protein PV10_05201 [Exophiala mesophila]KIV94044.1 hypothetical protein PV10_05201 [Exophiala mesophila]